MTARRRPDRLTIRYPDGTAETRHGTRHGRPAPHRSNPPPPRPQARQTPHSTPSPLEAPALIRDTHPTHPAL